MSCMNVDELVKVESRVNKLEVVASTNWLEDGHLARRLIT